MENSSIIISNTISKVNASEELSMFRASLDDAARRIADSAHLAPISNERIQKDDEILETYKVASDAINGGMGSVWRVHHQSWNIDLAMKRPQPKFFAEGGETKKKQFVEECENWINLGLHPNVVSCYYVREIGGVPTIFSEWMDRGSLTGCIKDKTLYEGSEEEIQERILNIAIQAAYGLRYAHENNLLHLDMKPGNLLLTKGWDAKIADFGLSSAITRLQEGSESIKISGYTSAYCPAEQINQEEPGGWMDVYSWALTVLEMYAGKRLWDTGAEAAARFEIYPGLCEHSIPEDIIPVLKSCLTEKPDNFDGTVEKLCEIYRGMTGTEGMSAVSKVADTSDILNNRALSFIDLGMPGAAETLLQRAIEEKSDSENAVFNYALLRWRSGSFSDRECLDYIESHIGGSDNITREIDRERGYSSASGSGISLGSEAGLPVSKSDYYSFDSGNSHRFIGLYSQDCSDIWAYNFNVIGCGEDGYFKKQIFKACYHDNEKRGKSYSLADAFNGTFDLDRGFDYYFVVIGDTLLIHTDETHAGLFRFGETEPYATVQIPENAYFLTDDDDHLVVVHVEETEADKKDKHNRHFEFLFYDSLDELQKEHPFRKKEIELAGDSWYRLFFSRDRIIYVEEQSVTVFMWDGNEGSAVFHTNEENHVLDAVYQSDVLYVLTEDELLALRGEDLQKRVLCRTGVYSGSIDITPDGRHIAAFTKGPGCSVRIIDVAGDRCIADWHEDRMKEWREVAVKATGNDRFALHLLNEVYDNRDYGDYSSTHEYCIEYYRIPDLGEPCDWELSKIQSINERLEADRVFKESLVEIRSLLEQKDIPACLEAIDSARRIPGFEQSLKLWDLNRKAGQEGEILGIRYFRAVTPDECPLLGNDEYYLAGDDLLLARENETAGTFGLYRFTTGELLHRWPVREDAVMACVSSDGSAAVILQDFKEDGIAVSRLCFSNGEIRTVPVSAKVDRSKFHAAAAGSRVLVVDAENEIMIEDDKVVRINKTEKGSSYRRYFNFSRNGKYLVSSYSGYQETDSGQSVLVCLSDELFSGNENTVMSAGAMGVQGVSVSNSGEALGQFDESAILYYPDNSLSMVRCVAERDERHFKFSGFTPDEAGFVTIDREGEMFLYLPKNESDYRIVELKTDPRSGLAYMERDNMIVLKRAQSVSGASKIAVDGNPAFSSSGSAFIDAAGTLWIIDYQYCDGRRTAFRGPSPDTVHATAEFINEKKKEEKVRFRERQKKQEERQLRLIELRDTLLAGILLLVIGVGFFVFQDKLPRFTLAMNRCGIIMIVGGAGLMLYGVIHFLREDLKR